MKTYRRLTPPPPRDPLSDAEIEAVAQILHILGGIPDWRRRIEVAACAIKVGIMSEDDERHEEIRRAAGITPKGG